MKNAFTFIVALLLCCRCFAQVVVDRKNTLTAFVTEKYQTVIEKKKEVKHGTYEAYYNKNILIAQGQYVDDKKSGIWHFFDKRGRPMQTFNYDTNTLVDEAAEDTSSRLRYTIDAFKPKDKVTKPIKIGGRYYGYLPYLLAFKLPANVQPGNYPVTLELLVSPLGRLADYKIHFFQGQDEQVLNVNTELFKDEDRQFAFAATLNGQPAACRIIITCYLNYYNELEM